MPIVDKSVLEIYLEKQHKPKWWNCVVKGAPTIDTTRLQPESSKLSDLDPEARTMVEKMMFDQQQKMRGLPTTDELRKLEALNKFQQQHPELDVGTHAIL
ncbi:hypothetical protein EV182_001506 [Spiromyces aspiralis]|uniref:Uncharacterized protein n=1 Tax=Spiromyces aspiralis TaxID=68401 RepID=A0ACC1HTC6_9FUNG|nr:hypothetical protein EV182_001506 [Spiromyces aspiralis]